MERVLAVVVFVPCSIVSWQVASALSGCSFMYFQHVPNVADNVVRLVNATKVMGVSQTVKCGMLCLLSSNCKSVTHDQGTGSRYMSPATYNYSSCAVETNFSYSELTTTCTDFNECSLSPLCSAIPLSRTVYSGCIDANTKGNTASGPYYVDPDKSGSFLVWCDFVGDEAWAVIQRRLDGHINFYRGWQDYKNGFGDVTSEYWLGLDRIYRLTSSSMPKLYIYLDDFNGTSKTANYSFINVTDEMSAYTLLVGNYSGNAGDALGVGSRQQASGMKFSTWDRDNDNYSTRNCAEYCQGAWWYRNCHQSNLNGAYLRGNHSLFANGVQWIPWTGDHYSLRTAIMRIAV